MPSEPKISVRKSVIAKTNCMYSGSLSQSNVYKNALGAKDVFTLADSETFAAMREKKPLLRSSGYCKFFREFRYCPYYLGYLY